MIGVFDSGHGGLTVLRALVARFPGQSFCYLGDHAHVPYGDRTSAEVADLTRWGVEQLFQLGCRLVVLGCNTATAVAARHLQQVWLIESGWCARGHNVIGIIAPTVEAATQTPWAVTSPQYPQKFNADTIVVFATTRTVASRVYSEEILKRCPRARVMEVACSGLADAIEAADPQGRLAARIAAFVAVAQAGLGPVVPDRAILGCTHYPLVEPLFRAALPAGTRMLSQPGAVADSLDDYLARHPQYASQPGPTGQRQVMLLTTGNATAATKGARVFWPETPGFAPCPLHVTHPIGRVGAP